MGRIGAMAFRRSRWGPRSAGDALALRDFGLTGVVPVRRASFEGSPILAVLYGGDTPGQWLRTGQALQRVLLTATAHGVATSLLTQPLEIPELRDRLTEPTTGWPAQAIVRLGYTRRLAARSLRRPLSEVVLVREDEVGTFATTRSWVPLRSVNLWTWPSCNAAYGRRSRIPR